MAPRWKRGWRVERLEGSNPSPSARRGTVVVREAKARPAASPPLTGSCTVSALEGCQRWSIGPASKAVRGHTHGGSNPSPSARPGRAVNGHMTHHMEGEPAGGRPRLLTAGAGVSSQGIRTSSLRRTCAQPRTWGRHGPPQVRPGTEVPDVSSRRPPGPAPAGTSPPGGLAERPKAAVLNAARAHTLGGSNPSSSAPNARTIEPVPTVMALLETVPPDNTGVHPGRETRELRVEADTYVQGRDQLLAQVPDGWRVAWLRTT